MSGIGILLTSAILSDASDLRRYKFSHFAERGDSGMSLRRQAGMGERAISGVPSTAEIHAVAQELSAADYEWLIARLGLPIQLRVTNFSARVVIKSADRERVAARSDTEAWGVRLVFYVIERI